MKRFFEVSIVPVLFLLGACSVPPTVDRSCTDDSQCELTTVLPDDCCDKCHPSPMNETSLKQVRDYCRTVDRNCPVLSCPDVRFEAKCVSGECVAEKQN